MFRKTGVVAAGFALFSQCSVLFRLLCHRRDRLFEGCSCLRSLPSIVRPNSGLEPVGVDFIWRVTAVSLLVVAALVIKHGEDPAVAVSM